MHHYTELRFETTWGRKTGIIYTDNLNLVKENSIFKVALI